jgi:hypothetical protein
MGTVTSLSTNPYHVMLTANGRYSHRVQDWAPLAQEKTVEEVASREGDAKAADDESEAPSGFTAGSLGELLGVLRLFDGADSATPGQSPLPGHD